MKRIAIPIFTTLLLIFTNVCCSEVSEEQALYNLVNECYLKISQNDFVGAAKLFHYPPHYLEDKKNKDIEGVSKSLESLSKSFGNISDPVSYKGGKEIISLNIGGGDLQYWKDNPRYISFTYNIKFSNYGDGYLIMTVCNLNNEFEIREVKYGLEKSIAKSALLLKEASKQLQILLKYSI